MLTFSFFNNKIMINWEAISNTPVSTVFHPRWRHLEEGPKIDCLQSAFSPRICLHVVGGPQVGEVLKGWVTHLSIKAYIWGDYMRGPPPPI